MLWCTVCSIQQECAINTIICIYMYIYIYTLNYRCKELCFMCVMCAKKQLPTCGICLFLLIKNRRISVDLLHHDMWKELHRRISREQLQADAATDTIEYCL